MQGDGIMVKLIGKNSFYFIGKLKDIMLQLALIEDKDITVVDYIKQQTQISKNKLN